MEIELTRTLNSQVGGHAGVLTTEDGSLLIKVALSRELEIYQIAIRPSLGSFAALYS